MSFIQSAKLNRLDPYAYLRDVLERLPTQPANRIAELLPHRWSPTTGYWLAQADSHPLPVGMAIASRRVCRWKAARPAPGPTARRGRQSIAG